MAEPKGHGGKREGAGRKLAGDKPRRPVTVWLDEAEVAYLFRAGKRNTSAGVRELIRRDQERR